MVLAKSNRDVNQKEAIGNSEFTLTPRALFAPDGTILPCHDKTKLIHLLNKLTKEVVSEGDLQLPQARSILQQDADSTSSDAPSRNIALVDGMVLVQKLSKKPVTMVTAKECECFNEKPMSLTRDCEEIIMVFDTYRPKFLKNATRDK